MESFHDLGFDGNSWVCVKTATKVKVNSLVYIKLKTVHQINKNRITKLTNSTSRLHPKELEVSSQKDVCTLMSIAAFSTTAKEVKVTPFDKQMDEEIVGCMYNGVSQS